jgi:hypothetical protein
MSEVAMARGFESKSVADQQEQVDAPVRGQRADVDPVVLVKRRRLELALLDVQHQLTAAHADGHREMLRRAETALRRDLKALG